jgi:hypothetical protein
MSRAGTRIHGRIAEPRVVGPAGKDAPTVTAATQTKPATSATWVNACILLGSGVVVLGLVVSAIFAPEWRMLHALQALIYVALVVLTRRKSAWGFGAGAMVAAFWDAIAVFATPLLREGTQELSATIQTGSMPRPDLLLQLLAFGGHILITIACLVGFFCTRPGARHWGQFVAGGVLVICYFAAIVFSVGPEQAAGLFRRLLGL